MMPSSAPHCPRCSCQGCWPPGVALARSSDTVVLPLREPGVIEAAPLIWTAPARSAGLARLACHRELRLSSLVVTSTAWLWRKGLHEVRAKAETTSRRRRAERMGPSGGGPERGLARPSIDQAVNRTYTALTDWSMTVGTGGCYPGTEGNRGHTTRRDLRAALMVTPPKDPRWRGLAQAC